MTSERVASDAPLNSADIDVGGTFTDAVLTLDGQRWIGKAPTTPYDLSVCFVNAIEEVALEAGQDLESLLPRLDVIRYSTTVAMNRLIERRGPRVGLITTEGHEDAILIGRGAQWTDGTRLAERRNLAVQRKPEPLIARTMIVGVKERIDSTGRVIRPLDEDDLRRKLRLLMDRGARSIVVSLLWSFANPRHEERAKEIIREEYKEYHIGYLPVVLSSQVVPKLGEYERTMTAVLDAYLQRSMQTELSAMWDRLRTLGYKGSFLMIHNSGGSGEVFKTTASRTYNGGPVSGLMGSYHLATSLGYKNVVAGDMGGTSFDIGLVVDAERPQLRIPPDHRPLDGRHHDAPDPVDRGRRRVDRLDQPRSGRPPQRRPAQRRLGPRPGLLRPGRYRADRHRRRRRARLHQPGDLLRGPDAAEPRQGRTSRPGEDRRPDGHRRRAGRRADPPHRRPEHAQRHQARDPPARLPPGGLRAVRVRRGRARPTCPASSATWPGR